MSGKCNADRDKRPSIHRLSDVRWDRPHAEMIGICLDGSSAPLNAEDSAPFTDESHMLPYRLVRLTLPSTTPQPAWLPWAATLGKISVQWLYPLAAGGKEANSKSRRQTVELLHNPKTTTPTAGGGAVGAVL
jgi:hypothetical protein